VLCAHFLATFLRYRCLDVTTLFNIDVKTRFRAIAANCSAAILRLCCGQFICMQHVFQVFQSAFSHVTVQFRRATTELCNFEANQSTLCCFDGFRTLYCCVNEDVSFCKSLLLPLKFITLIQQSWRNSNTITFRLALISPHYVLICLSTAHFSSKNLHIYRINGLIRFTFHSPGGATIIFGIFRVEFLVFLCFKLVPHPKAPVLFSGSHKFAICICAT